METTTLRIRMEATSCRNSNRWSYRIGFWRLILTFTGFILIPETSSQLYGDIPWAEVVQRLAYEDDKLARRPQGHNGEYFFVCTLYSTPKEKGYTVQLAFAAELITNACLPGTTDAAHVW